MEPDAPSTDPVVQAADRHASWPELFFDLVAVAGVAGLAHTLSGEFPPLALGLYATLFIAFWLTWTTYMLHGNSSSDGPHLTRLLAGMFGLGVMAAAIPGLTAFFLGHGDGHSGALQANIFALAYIVTRSVGAHSWDHWSVVTEFPVVQQTIGVVPWLVSLWVSGNGKLILWAVGLAIDVVALTLISGEDRLRHSRERVAAVRSRAERAETKGRGRVHRDRHGNRRTMLERIQSFQVQGVRLAPEHLAERLGLLVIIVLGEGVIQVVHSASEVEWHRSLLVAALASFVLLVGLFVMSLELGHAGIPYLREGSVGVRSQLALHALVTATLAALATALASVINEPGTSLPAQQRWLLCGSVAAYFALGVAAAALARARRPLAMGIAFVTGVLVPLGIAVLADDTSGTGVVGYVVLVVVGHMVLWRRRGQPTDGPPVAAPAGG